MKINVCPLASIINTTEMRMLRWARGKTMIHVETWKQAHPMAEFLRDKMLRWFDHVPRRHKDEATIKILLYADGSR